MPRKLAHLVNTTPSHHSRSCTPGGLLTTPGQVQREKFMSGFVLSDTNPNYCTKKYQWKSADGKFARSDVRDKRTTGHLSPLLSPVPHGYPRKGLAPGGGIEPPLTDSKSNEPQDIIGLKRP